MLETWSLCQTVSLSKHFGRRSADQVINENEIDSSYIFFGTSSDSHTKFYVKIRQFTRIISYNSETNTAHEFTNIVPAFTKILEIFYSSSFDKMLVYLNTVQNFQFMPVETKQNKEITKIYPHRCALPLPCWRKWRPWTWMAGQPSATQPYQRWVEGRNHTRGGWKEGTGNLWWYQELEGTYDESITYKLLLVERGLRKVPETQRNLW